MTLEVRSLELVLPGGQCLCRDLSFSLADGDVLVVQGESGSGKSSILNWMTGTLHPDIQASGSVWLDGRDITHWPTEHRRLGLMLQQDYLFPHMSVAENLLFGLREAGSGAGRAERRAQVEASLREIGLDGYGERHPDTLSGGQRARVSLMRTLLSAPRAVLLDEPFSRLDKARREQIRTFVWRQTRALPVLLVTHDRDDIPTGARILSLAEPPENAPAARDPEH